MNAGARLASEAWRIAASVPDPEMPMVTLADLGILRDVVEDDAGVTVTITPTYSGCPAMREIAQDLRNRLRSAGFTDVTVCTALTPPWTTDWITEAGRDKLAAAGVAPPNPVGPRGDGPVPLLLTPRVRHVRCPHCGSTDTQEAAAFSATACTALFRCAACSEPFPYVKEI